MKYKLICIDMDGTLLDDKKNVSEANIKAIKMARDKGIKVVIATGRVFSFTWYYYKLLGIKGPAITSNGALIEERGAEKSIYKSPFKFEDCVEILKLLKKYDIVPCFYTDKGILSQELKFAAKGYEEFNKDKEEEFRIKVSIVNDWEKCFKENDGNILKTFVMAEDNDRIIKLRKELEKYPQFSVTSSSPVNFEIMKKGVDKGRAVSILASYYGISMDEVICIGDSENDTTMIECAGLGIAMENATDELKNKAKYVTDTNNNDGVAKAIEKFVLNVN